MAKRMRNLWQSMRWGLLLCLGVMLIQPSAGMDRRLSDQLLRDASVQAATDILLVEVTTDDVRLYGRPILGRENLALLLNHLADEQAGRVLVDIYLADEIDPVPDGQIAAALVRFDREQIGLVSAAGPEHPPADFFAQHTTVLDARLTPDSDGWHRQVGADAVPWGLNAAQWLGTGQNTSEPVALDLRIADSVYETVSVHEVLQGDVAIAGRRVIVSPSPEVASSRAYLPLSETASRARVLAVAAQSAEQQYGARLEQAGYLSLALQLAAVLLGFACAMLAKSGIRLLLSAGAAYISLVVLNVVLARSLGTPVTVALTSSCFFIMLNVTLIRRFRIVGLMSNFMRGDLSPEEALAWRVNEEGNTPAVLFAADGKVKRANSAAHDINASFAAQLAPACMPKPGERSSEINLEDADGRRSSFRLDWPFDNVPIAILHDVTEAKQREASLINQLHEDGLTGTLNRRGFENAIGALASGTQGYSVMYVDLNGFKAVNDTYGHDAGDEILCHVTQALRASVREGDSVARLGGDEFAILLPGNLTVERLEAEAARLERELSQPVMLSTANVEASVGAAIGFASAESHDESADAILRRADQMMYERKAAMKSSLRAA